MAETYVWTVTAQQAGKRMDSLLAEEMDISRSSAQQWLEQGLVTANGKILNKKDKLKEGTEVTVNAPDPVAYDIVAEDIPLDVAYEDEHLLVVNKPKGMVVHPAAGHYSGTLVNALMHHCGDSLSGINGVLRPGIVHRIDMDTSGLLIVAKNDKTHQGLAEQIKVHSFTRLCSDWPPSYQPQEDGRYHHQLKRSHHTLRSNHSLCRILSSAFAFGNRQNASNTCAHGAYRSSRGG